MIAIHPSNRSFSDGWIKYCTIKAIPFRIVNCFDNDLAAQLCGCKALMWHYHHAEYQDSLVARQILNAVEHLGLQVFPNFRTAWHFDDKLGQKYLLEQCGESFVSTYIFYEKELALDWASNAVFPKVFKLRRGAGSQNVKLVISRKEAKKLIRKSFARGHCLYTPLNNLFDRYRAYKRGEDSLIGLFKGLARCFIWPKYYRRVPREAEYVYFQDFIPHNNSDIRIIIIGDRAFFIRRMNREGDFRASGSGKIINAIDHDVIRCVEEAFRINNYLKAQVAAFDFLIGINKEPKFVEISYGFDVSGYFGCKGYWDLAMNWHEGFFDYHGWMVEDLLRLCAKK